MKNLQLYIALFSSIVIIAQQHPGDLDPSFTPEGIPFSSNYAIVVKSDQKILVGRSTLNSAIPAVVCLNPNGSIDSSFNAWDGIVSAQKIVLQPDGKIIVLGDIGQYGSITRLNADGSRDLDFNVGTNSHISYPIFNAVIQDDGKIIVSGSFTTFNGIARNNIARLNPNGTLDAVFAPVSGLPNLGYSYYRIFGQPDGKIILAGKVSDPQNLKIYLSRLNRDGTLDISFNSGIYFNGSITLGSAWITSIQTTPAGKIFIAGDFLASNGISGVSMLNADGSVDAAFNPGTGALGTFGYTNVAVNSALIEPSGKIILAGGISYYYTFGTVNIPRHLLRINPDGSIDTSFLLEGPSISAGIYGAALQLDGKIVIGGYPDILIRLLSDVNLGLPTETVKTNNTSIYPNPVKSQLKIISTTPITAIEIYSGLGQVISYSTEATFEKNINMESFPKGLYFVKINFDKESEIRKIIKD